MFLSQPDYDVEMVQYSSEQQVYMGGSSRKAILEAANRVGEASNDLLRYVMQEDDEACFGYDEHGNPILQMSLAEEERIYQVSMFSFILFQYTLTILSVGFVLGEIRKAVVPPIANLRQNGRNAMGRVSGSQNTLI